MLNALRNAAKQTMFGVIMQQSWLDLWLWEQLLNACPGMKAVIEIGTKHGGLSLYLLSQTTYRDMAFWTCDINPCPYLVPRKHFLEGNVFRSDGKQLKELLISAPHPLILLCDGGDKQMEFKMFVPYLQPGDIVGAHDWGSEFWPRSIGCVAQYIEPIMFAECEALNSMTRFWVRVQRSKA